MVNMFLFRKYRVLVILLQAIVREWFSNDGTITAAVNKTSRTLYVDYTLSLTMRISLMELMSLMFMLMYTSSGLPAAAATTISQSVN